MAIFRGLTRKALFITKTVTSHEGWEEYDKHITQVHGDLMARCDKHATRYQQVFDVPMSNHSVIMAIALCIDLSSLNIFVAVSRKRP